LSSDTRDVLAFTVDPDGAACGCTDEEADNYDEYAEKDDDSCLFTKRLKPLVECVYPEEDGSYTAYFGYNNESNYDVTVDLGDDNEITPSEYDGSQTTFFPADMKVSEYPDFAHSVNFDAEEEVEWSLTGPDGNTRRATASWDEDTVVCPVACGDGRLNTDGEAPEACDDGNLENGDGCSDLCELEPLPTVEVMPMCADGSVYARIATDFEGTMMVGPYATVTNEWFVVYEEGAYVEYANDNTAEVDGMFVTQSDDGTMTIRHYGETTEEVTTLEGSVAFMNAVGVIADPETGDFKFENGAYVDELTVEDTAVNFLMYVRG
jgi:cysteine-rich repeat protein